MKTTWVDILNRVKSGDLTAEEGAELLQHLEEQDALEAQAGMAAQESTNTGEFPNNRGAQGAAREAMPSPTPEERVDRWRSWWMVPFWAGLAIFMLGSAWMAVSYINERYFWFACAWLPLLFGLLVLVIAAWSRTARWLHVRINDPSRDGGKATRIALSFPVPIHLAGWALRVFGPRFPKFKDMNMDMIAPVLEALEKSSDPLSVEVDDKDGETVQVYIV